MGAQLPLPTPCPLLPLSPSFFPSFFLSLLSNSASSPIGATVVTFWSLLTTQYGKLEAASNAAGIEWVGAVQVASS